MKKIITLLFVCMSSLGYGAEFQDTDVYDFDTNLPLSPLIGENQLSDVAVLAVPVSMGVFEDLGSDEIDPGNFYFCGIQGCFECFSTIQDRTEHEMRVHGQGYSQAPRLRVLEQAANGGMMMAQDGLGFVSLQQPVVVPEAASVQRSMDLQPRQKICGVCDKHFGSHAALVVHMRSHTGEKPYACSYEGCASRFALSQYLKEHVRTHTGERPYVCSHKDCGSRFTLSHHLKDHMRTHAGERPFGCKECGKWFSRNSHLKEHMRIHTGEKSYVCSHKDCGKALTTKWNLKEHMRRVHEQTDKATSGSLSSEQLADNNLEENDFQQPVVVPAPVPVSFGSLSPKLVVDNDLDEDEETDNADEGRNNAKRMRRFDPPPAPVPAPAPIFMDVFEDLPSDQINAAHSYICVAEGCFECFSTIQDRTNHEMRVHGQTLGFRVLEQDGNGDMMMPLDGLGSVGFQQPVAVPAPGVFGSLSPEQAVDQDL